ncbi:MAG: PEP-CTERM sorting domain-containing protein [Candidatus Nealsonbacteria bacterium]|nr:PEP-CTERM sorting domain-containing protein [Candidatus Nealsonbacteria bacterium]
MAYLGNGGGWGNPAGALIVSADPLGTVDESLVYTLSMMANGAALPTVLDLLADGVALTPSSSVDPVLSDVWQEYSRTYDATSLAGLDGQSLTIVLGHGRPAAGSQSRYDDVTLNAVPEPSTLLLAAIGLLSLVWYGWRRR